MDAYFKLPTGYACYQRNGDNIYAYTSDYRTRDTFELDNFKYVKISTTSSVNQYNVNTCLPSTMSHLIPSSFAPYMFVSASLFICVLMIGLFNVFKR